MVFHIGVWANGVSERSEVFLILSGRVLMRERAYLCDEVAVFACDEALDVEALHILQTPFHRREIITRLRAGSECFRDESLQDA